MCFLPNKSVIDVLFRLQLINNTTNSMENGGIPSSQFVGYVCFLVINPNLSMFVFFTGVLENIVLP